MAFVKKTASNISITSTWTCNCTLLEGSYKFIRYCDETTQRKTVRFNIANAIPAGATITSTRVHSVWAGALYGYRIATVGGKQPNSSGMVTLANPATTATYYDVEFAFSALPESDSTAEYNHKNGDVQVGSVTRYRHTTTATISEIYLRIDYTGGYTACGAPTSVTLAKSMSMGGTVELAWSGATPGTGNAISGYQVQRCPSADGVTWGAWEDLAQPAASPLAVEPPSTPGHYYKYRVRTKGAAGSAYYSGYKECATTLRRDHEPLEGFTDDPLQPGITPVKALHMAELQDRVSTLRSFYGLTAYTFTPAIAGETGLALWRAQVEELRAAVDEISTAHDAWIDIPVNCPRADVIHQLRAVVLSL